MGTKRITEKNEERTSVRYRPKLDANHREIVRAFESMGCCVLSLAAVGKGCPDILTRINGQLVLVEIKGAKGKLTDDQVRFHAAWEPEIVRSVEEACRVFQKYSGLEVMFG
jgi:hypothetical protein